MMEILDLQLKTAAVEDSGRFTGLASTFGNIDLVNEICAILDDLQPASVSYATLITHVTDRPGHDRRYAMDISKIKAELDWKPRHDIESGLHETVEWYLANLDWVAKISKKNDFQDWMEKNYSER